VSVRPPDVNELVSVRRQGVSEDLRSRVEETAPSWLALAHPSDGEEVVELYPGEEIVVEWLTPRGLGAVTGRVAGRAAISVPALAVDLVEEPRLLQRRSDVRASVWIEATARRPAAPAEGEEEEGSFSVTAVDLSAGGVAILAHRELEVDETLVVTLELPDGPVEAHCSVRRVARENVYGLRFDRIREADRERVVQLVFAAMRDELARKHV